MGTVELTCVEWVSDGGFLQGIQDRRTYGVGDDEDVGLGGVLSSGLGEVADDGGVGVEQVVTGHAGLAGHTSGDNDDLSALEGLGETGGSGIVAADLRARVSVNGMAGGSAGGGVPRSWC